MDTIVNNTFKISRADYSSKILSLFINKYHFLLDQGTIPTFSITRDITLRALDLSSDFPKEIENILCNWHKNIFDLCPIKTIMLDESIREIIIHDENLIHVEKQGTLHPIENLLFSQEDLESMYKTLALKGEKEWNYATPFQSFYLELFEIQFRVTLIHYSVTPKSNSKIFLRKIKKTPFSLDKFNLKTSEISFVKKCIKEKKNIVIAGATSSGKTSFLSAMIDEITINEHLVILEDTFELIAAHPNHTNLLAQKDIKNKSLKEYCSYSLRMRPDRIIIGEMRSDEVVPFFLAMNTGHKGLMSTIHANSAQLALSRLALLFCMYSGIKEMSMSLSLKLVCENIDYIFFLENKSIKEVIKVLGSEENHSYVETILSDDADVLLD